MNNYIRFGLALVFTELAYFLFFLGYDWLTVGYGLNPWIAFPCGILALYIGTANAYYAVGIMIYEHKARQFRFKAKVLRSQRLEEFGIK